MKDTIVGGKAVVFDDRACGDNFLAGDPRFTDLADVFIALQSSVEELAIERRRLSGNSKGTVNLCGVTPVTNRQFRDDHASWFEYTGRWFLPGHEAIGLVHMCRRNEMNSRLTAVLDVRAVNNRQDVVLRQARSKVLLQGLASQIREISAPSEMAQLFLASDSPNSTASRAELDEFSFGKESLQFRDMTVGHSPHADQTNSTLAQLSLADCISQSWNRRRAIPANVTDSGLSLGAGLMVEEMDEHRGRAFPREEQPTGGLREIV